jgi:hypothetical protein
MQDFRLKQHSVVFSASMTESETAAEIIFSEVGNLEAHTKVQVILDLIFSVSLRLRYISSAVWQIVRRQRCY